MRSFGLGPNALSEATVPETPEQRERRIAIFNHNGMRGGVAMSKSHMERIIQSATATKASKELATKIRNQLYILNELMERRVDS